MRTLLLLRGSVGCGKSTWIEKHGLKPYTLSADDIRLLCQGPVMNADGSFSISNASDDVVWKMLFTLLETRMQRGEFTVIDATNSKTSEMNRYKSMCETYRYRMFCVDFTDIPIEEVKRRNAGREPVKRVPESVIDNMYSRFRTQKIPSGIKVIKPDEIDKIWMKRFDLSEYKRIHHIGDIHGCNTSLQKYLSDNGGIKDDEFYIFCGDYIDRGLENADVVKFLISIKDRKNVLLLEGNHERLLWLYANDCTTRSKEFELQTVPELDSAEIDKKDIRQLYRKFGQCAYYNYGDKVFLVSHGGLSTMPDNLTTVATTQLINGAGDFGDFEEVASAWVDNTPENFYQVHGHRNPKSCSIQITDRVFNLDGAVEFGGELRCVQVDTEGVHAVAVKNDVYKVPEVLPECVKEDMTVADMVNYMQHNRFIKEKRFGNFSSFNFTESAFFGQIWNTQTVKARGLYVDVVQNKIVGRAYNKFFNINERPETKLEMLQHRLKFPVTAYVKENGFFGLVSYDEYNDDLLIASKSTLDSNFAKYLKDMVYDKISEENRAKMKEYAKENSVSFIFECVDMKNDPHIIDYPESQLFLLDIVHNDINFSKLPYEELKQVGAQFGLQVKEKAYEIKDWHEFYDWYYDVTKEDYLYNDRHIEGFVIEDSDGYMVKLKLHYYSFWKYMRSIAQEAIRDGYTRRTSSLTTPLANEFYAWVRKLHDTENLHQVPKDICTLRSLFYNDK